MTKEVLHSNILGFICKILHLEILGLIEVTWHKMPYILTKPYENTVWPNKGLDLYEDSPNDEDEQQSIRVALGWSRTCWVLIT